MRNVIAFLILTSLTAACATRIPVKDSKLPLSDSANPVIMIQYRMSANKEFAPSIYFRDSAGKDFRVSVPKSSNPEAGVLFELPAQGAVRVVKFSHPDASLPIDVERFFPVFYPEKGRINHIGFLSFKLEADALYVSPIKREEAAGLLKKAQTTHGLSESDIVNAYTGKPIPAQTDNGVVQYQYVSTNKGKVSFEDKVWKCQTDETKKNLIIMGTLRFLISVSSGKVSDVKLLKSNHSASADFEACAQDKLKSAEVSEGTFKADLPIIF